MLTEDLGRTVGEDGIEVVGEASDGDEALVTLTYLPGGDRPARVDLLLDGEPSGRVVVPARFGALESRWQAGGVAPFMLSFTDVLISQGSNDVVADFIRFARTEGRFAKHFDKDGNPSETLIKAKQERLDNWRTLQELAGII